MKRVLIIVLGLLVGVCIGYIVVKKPHLDFFGGTRFSFLHLSDNEVIGFLPYWLLGRASTDDVNYLTTLTYYGLTVDTDGSIRKLQNNDQETEPGWLALQSDRLKTFLQTAEKKTIKRSLLVFNGDPDEIDEIMSDPVSHAKNMTRDVIPVMNRYGFSDLNIDIENVRNATDGAQKKFTAFLRQVRKDMDAAKAGTITVDISPSDLIFKRMINPRDAGNIADHVILMTYDYHYAGSSVTGAVAPLSGAGITSEYDTEAAVQLAEKAMPSDKIVLGVPLYGYEWETISKDPRSAVIPGTGITLSSGRADQFLTSCATCSAQFDKESQEAYLVYHDEDTGTYHQLFYPNAQATAAKTDFASKYHLAGVALWALGYEDPEILKPLADYIN